jgi:hypothetical protein
MEETQHHAHHNEGHPKKSVKSNLIAYGLVALIYLIIALVIFYPITTHMGSYSVGGAGGDTYQNLWDIWWIKYALLNLHQSIYSTKLLFWPVGANLVYQTMSPLASLITIPFQAAGTVFAYNVLFFVGFFLSGLGMYVLADYLIKNKYAAFLSGLIFTFSAVHIAQSYAHIEFIVLAWIPLFTYFLLKIIDEGWNPLNVIGMSASFAFSTLMGSTEQSIMLVLIFILVVVIKLCTKEGRKKVLNKYFVASILIFLVLAFVIGSWEFVPVAKLILSPGGLSNANYLNSVQYNALWSIDSLSFFLPSFYSTIFHGAATHPGLLNSIYAIDPTERIGYIGYIALALAIYGVYKYRKSMYGWLAGFIIFALLALGPFIQIAGTLTPIPAPYALYRLIPALNIIREPGRFDLVAMMFISILAGFGAVALLERLQKHMHTMKNAALIVTAVLTILILIETNGLVYGHGLVSAVAANVSVPSFYKEIGALPTNFSTLSLPALPSNASATPALYVGEATFYTSVSHKALVGGYITRENLTDQISLYNIPLAVQASNLENDGTFGFSSPVSQNYTAQSLLGLYNYNTAFVVVQKGAYNNDTLNFLDAYLYKIFGAPVYNTNSTIAFETVNAINASIFRNFTAVPLLTDWEPASLPYNGTSLSIWVPLNYGEITLSVPYPKGTILANASKTQTYPVNTTISFKAIALNTPEEQLTIGISNGNGELYKVATLNVTDKLINYEVTEQLGGGFAAEPTQVFFIPQSISNSTYVGIENITFSQTG